MRYRVKNWGTFQHYKRRRPPWIKLHRTILDDYLFSRLPDASRALAPMLWMLASESGDGSVSGDAEELAFRVRQPVAWTEKALKPLVDNGFLECLQDASAALAERKQDDHLETERETEREAEKRQRRLAPPTHEEVLAYAKERGQPAALARRFYDYFSAGGWRDSGGRPVRVWKQKFITWERHSEDPKPEAIKPNPDVDELERAFRRMAAKADK